MKTDPRDLRSGEVVHLELAVKFYLAVDSGAGEVRFPGPDPRDNWLVKLERMRAGQLRLAERVATRRLLLERFGVKAVTVRQRVYGTLFERVVAAQSAAPPFFSDSGRRAFWLYLKDWDAWVGERREFRIVPKPLWPVCIGEDVMGFLDTVDAEELRELARERCVMFLEVRENRVGFLVPDEWPG